MQQITLVLPYPISANVYWRSRVIKAGPGRPQFVSTYVSAEAQAYKAQVAKIAASAGIRSPIFGRVAIAYVLYPHRPLDYKKRMAKDPMFWDDTVQCIDLDNAQKVLLDSLKGVVMDDDKFVREIVARRAEPDGESRLVVTITPIVAAQPQSALFEVA